MPSITIFTFDPQKIDEVIKRQKQEQWSASRSIIATRFRKNLSKLTFCMVFIYILLLNGTAESSYREFQLFDHAYYSYLSYQPEEAIQQFRVFLEEFPESSAQDAALFWLAKSLLQVKSIEEAKKTFAYIEEQFPESPFICYVAKEIETLGNVSEQLSSVKRTVNVEAGQELVEAETPMVSEESTDQKTYDADNRSETERLKELLDRERAKTDFLLRRVKELEQRAAYVLNSSVVLDRLGIHNALWRDKNMFENFEIEHALYEKATSHSITTDGQQYNARIFIDDSKRPAYLNANGAPPGKKDSSEKGTDRENKAQGFLPSSEMNRDEKAPFYALQVGAFKMMESAETLRRSLQEKISTKKIIICQQEDFFKVRITGFDDIGEVNAMLNAGINGLVIKTNEKACGI